MWTNRFERFPEHTPVNKEYYLLRSIFEEHYPEQSALDTIPKGLSVACSTPEAIAWDPEWQNMHDISGRAVSVHSAAEDYSSASEMEQREMAASAWRPAVVLSPRPARPAMFASVVKGRRRSSVGSTLRKPRGARMF